MTTATPVVWSVDGSGSINSVNGLFTAGSTTAIATIRATSGSLIATLSIQVSTASVTQSGLTVTYDGTAKAISVSTVPPGLAVTTTYNGSGTAPTVAGTYTVVSTVTDRRFTGSVSGTLQIAKRGVSVGISALSAIYDGSAHPVTATTVPAGVPVVVTYNGSAQAPIAVGSYTVLATVSDPNRSGSATGTLVIAKATAAVSLSGLSATYDRSPHAVTVTTVPAGLTTSVTYAGANSPPTAVGSYPVTVVLTNGNYSGGASGTLVIARASATVSLAGLSAVADGNPHAVTVTTTPAGLAVTTTYNGSTTVPSASGTYPVISTIVDANYTGSASGILTIGSAGLLPATVNLAGLSVTYDGRPHAVTATTVPANLPVSITYAGSATPPTDAGSYAVVCTVTGGTYTGSATSTLVIARANATLSLSGLSAVYDGQAHAVTVASVPANLAVSRTYAGSSTPPTAVGSYAVTVTVTDLNYTASAAATLTIGKAPATITLGNLAAVEDGTAQEVTVVTQPPGLTVEVSYDGSAVVPITAGSHRVVATIIDASYSGSVSGTLVIASRDSQVKDTKSPSAGGDGGGGGTCGLGSALGLLLTCLGFALQGVVRRR